MEEDEDSDSEELRKRLVHRNSKTKLLFWGVFIAIHLVFFFLIPNQVRDESWLWVSIKWVMLIAMVALFIQALRQYQASKN